MKKAYYTGLSIFIGTFIFWLIYTIVFLFIEGWHIKAISQAELLLDLIVNVATTIATCCLIWSGLKAIEYVIYLQEDKDEYSKDMEKLVQTLKESDAENKEFAEKVDKLFALLAADKSQELDKKPVKSKKVKPKIDDTKADESSTTE